MTRDDLQKKLENLITLNIDAVEGFDKASGMIISDGFKEWLKMRMLEREAMAHEIAGLVKDIEEVDLDITSFKSKVHRAWMDIKGAMTDKTDMMIMKECLRGESFMLDSYREVNESLHAITKVGHVLTNHIEILEKSKVSLCVLQDALESVGTA